MSDGGQLKSFFDNLMRKQAREAGADRTMEFLDSFGQPSVEQDRITPQAFAMLSTEQQNQILRRLREEGVDLGPYMVAAGVEGTDVVDAANIAFNLPFDALSAVANLTNIERGREEGFGANVEGARGAFSESLDPDRFAAAEYAREIGAPFPEATGVALDVLAPGPGELKALEAFLPPAVMRALGKITGVVDETGSVVPMGHGTKAEFDEPQASESGLYGPGFYVAGGNLPEEFNNSQYRNLYNFYASEGMNPTPFSEEQGYAFFEGGRVIPGFYGVPSEEILFSAADKPLTEQQINVLRELFSDVAKIDDNPERILNFEREVAAGEYNQKRLLDTLLNFDDAPGKSFEERLADAGFSGIWNDFSYMGSIQNPAQNFLPAYDAPRIREFIDQNRSALTDEEYRAAMEVLDSVRDPNAPVSASGRQPLPPDYLERVRGWIGRTGQNQGRFVEVNDDPLSAQLYSEAMQFLPDGPRSFVTTYTPDEIIANRAAGDRYFITEQGAGFAIGKDGEFKGVFNAGPERGVAPEMVKESIERGATHLYAFDADKNSSVVNLPEIYGSVIHNGKQYQITERMPFNDDYAPENWNYDLYGRPDLVRMDLVEVGQ